MAKRNEIGADEFIQVRTRGAMKRDLEAARVRVQEAHPYEVISLSDVVRRALSFALKSAEFDGTTGGGA